MEIIVPECLLESVACSHIINLWIKIVVLKGPRVRLGGRCSLIKLLQGPKKGRIKHKQLTISIIVNILENLTKSLSQR